MSSDLVLTSLQQQVHTYLAPILYVQRTSIGEMSPLPRWPIWRAFLFYLFFYVRSRLSSHTAHHTYVNSSSSLLRLDYGARRNGLGTTRCCFLSSWARFTFFFFLFFAWCRACFMYAVYYFVVRMHIVCPKPEIIDYRLQFGLKLFLWTHGKSVDFFMVFRFKKEAPILGTFPKALFSLNTMYSVSLVSASAGRNSCLIRDLPDLNNTFQTY